jgi:hypothetical protein
MKRWQLGIIAATIGSSATAICFASFDHVGVGPPKPDELVPAAAEPTKPASAPRAAPAPAPGAPLPVQPPPREEARAPLPAPDSGTGPAAAAAPGIPSVPAPGSSDRRRAADGTVIYPLDGPGVREAVQAALPEIKDCYEGWHNLQPSLEGQLKIKMVIASDGGREGGFVEQISLLDDAGMGHAAFEGCVLSVLNGMRFDAPEGGGKMTIHYPLVFSGGDGHR